MIALMAKFVSFTLHAKSLISADLLLIRTTRPKQLAPRLERLVAHYDLESVRSDRDRIPRDIPVSRCIIKTIGNQRRLINSG
jgi:hypothetical protein